MFPEMSRTLAIGLLFAVLAAAALRLPELGVRPMHNDEGVNATKLRGLWEQGSYQYDPSEYHGPTLPYLSWAWMKLAGPKNFVDFDEAKLRMVTVIFGLGLILLLPLVADGLGPRATACAAMLTAISPAMVFYSRYFIHEMLLVFFTFLALAAGWRYTQSRRKEGNIEHRTSNIEHRKAETETGLGWALLAGAAVGLMQATKETFVLALAAMAAALIANRFWNRTAEAGKREPEFKYNFKHLAGALVMWLVVALLLFSSFFTNASGPLDAVRTYLPWLHRAGGASPHMHPWNFYVERLAWFHAGKGPVWSEGLILGLAVVGLVAAFVRKGLAEGETGFVRFVAFYAVVLAVIYSAIGYKTPWCLLSFWQGMILLAGVGTVALLHWLKARPLQIGAGALLIGLGGQLACQAWRADVQYAADPGNPYVYAQTSPDVENLVERLNGLAKVHSEKERLVIKVMSPENDYGPLQWYLRGFKQVGWYAEVPSDPLASVMIVSTKLKAGLDEKKTHAMVGLFQLRPQNWFEMYVETNLWNSLVKSTRLDDAQSKSGEIGSAGK
ncbi:MAG: hypothetical protein JWQ04_611 [Pedosphaera sp.]|nr:hypothetical protein [Pedosphaera sp.]